MNIAGHGYGDLGGTLPSETLPAIVERARLDKEWQEALNRVGYRRVKQAYARQMRKSPKDEVFYGLEHLRQWPTMEFVRVWLRAEKKRTVAKVRWTFMAAMLATIAGALTFTAALSVFR
jgi:chromatin segregation and condensation protein Rec8/ScpA/Scc1 (kleisin family)